MCDQVGTPNEGVFPNLSFVINLDRRSRGNEGASLRHVINLARHMTGRA